MLTSKRLESYPPKTWTLASATNSGLTLSIIVSIRVMGEASNPAKTKKSSCSELTASERNNQLNLVGWYW